MLSEKNVLKMIWEEEKKSHDCTWTPFYLQPSDLHSKAGRQSGCFLPANFKHLQTLDTEEYRGVLNHLVLDVQL